MSDSAMRPGGLTRTSLRLSLQFAFLYALLSALVLVVAYWATDVEVSNWIEERMRADAETLTQVHDQRGAAALIERIGALAEINFESSRVFRLTDADGAVLAGNILSVVPGRTDGFVALSDLSIEGPQVGEVSGYWLRQDRIGPFLLLQGTGDHVVAEVLEALSLALFGGFVVLLGLGLLVGVRVGRITEARIDAISVALERVSEGDLAARAPDRDGANDDLSRVSGRINETLDQLQALLESQRQISTDIAHDMRTPLQRLRQRLERMNEGLPLAAGDTAAALLETEEIIDTFNALLRIAQIEAGDRRARFGPVDLNRIAETVFEAFEPDAEESGHNLGLFLALAPVEVSGDRDLIMQMVANLVENALRHCPAGSQIDVGVGTSGGETSLWVSDTGDGITAADADKVFRRFYRGEQNRTSPGHGLGLAMVKAIADLHEAKVTMSDNRPGLRMTVTFAL